jgi:hypothetical protein
MMLSLASCLAGISVAALAEPPNEPLELRPLSNGGIELVYGGSVLAEFRAFTVQGSKRVATPLKAHSSKETGTRGELTQSIRFDTAEGAVVVGAVRTSEEGLAAETRPHSLRCVRTTVGRSDNLRNNAVYDRRFDWCLEGATSTRVKPASKGGFEVTLSGSQPSLTFKPRFYQKHKNLPFYEPWTYQVRKDTITGWCSWWAYFGDIHEKDITALVDVFDQKGLKDFGYRFIQMDDGYQKSPAGPPANWINWNSKFPSGMAGYVKTIKDKGFEPGIWIGSMFSDESYAKAHPDYFIKNDQGEVFKGHWVDYSFDATNPEAMKQLVVPLYQKLKSEGFTYVKIDTLRHLLYDGYYHAKPGYFESKGFTAETAYRAYWNTIRSTLGRDVFILSCWGVLPEGIGLADACRLGGDGYGPATMQQYNSWNGIVWRSDPDHCDVMPSRDPNGDVRDTIIRPALASMAGAMILVSDKPDVYANDRNLEGMKRSSPVLFSVPGQLYDYDPRKSDTLKTMTGHRQESGGPQGPIDADQKGDGCQLWVQEIERPFERWMVVARFAWDRALPAQTLSFSDLGLAPGNYVVYEFWGNRLIESSRDTFEAEALQEKTLRVYAIRKLVNHPQVLSTNRHLSQGCPDLELVKWSPAQKTLSGKSNVIKSDPYEVRIHVPKGFTVASALVNGQAAKPTVSGKVLTLGYTPSKTETIKWQVAFK